METIVIYSGEKCRVIQIDWLLINNMYYYGVKVNLNGFGCGFAAGPINNNDCYLDGRPYPYKESTYKSAINKALDYLLNYLTNHLNGFCREDSDINYVQHKINLVRNYKKEFNNKNTQLTLF